MRTYRFHGKLVAETPLHVGSGEGDERADSLMIRQHEGKGIIFGTALAGVIRDLAELESPGKDAFEYLFGDTKARKATDREGHLWIFDAPSENAKTFVQERVAIEASTMTAATGKLFSQENSIKTSSYKFYARLDLEEPNSDPAKEAARLCWRVLEHLMDGEVMVGGLTGIGRGRVKLEELTIDSFDWTQAWENENYSGEKVEDFKKQFSCERSGPQDKSIYQIIFEAELKIETPVSINFPVPLHPFKSHPDDNNGQPPQHAIDVIQQALGRVPELLPDLDCYDGAPYRYALEDPHSAYLPGSSLRGALRSRLLRIIRTKTERNDLAWETYREGDPEKGFAPKIDKVKDPKAEACLVSRLFGFSALGGKIRVEDVALGGLAEKGMMHVAIDRFSRAAGDRKLFRSLTIWPGEKNTVMLRLKLVRPDDYDIGVAALLLKDIYRGHVRIGSDKTAGNGRLGLDSCKIIAYAPGNFQELTLPKEQPREKIGSYEKRELTVDCSKSDPQKEPSWIPVGHPWFEYLNKCAKKVYSEIEEKAKNASLAAEEALT